jgi:murein DD-endopeptidase MepM/ murein hydrolase activator NlpD
VTSVYSTAHDGCYIAVPSGDLELSSTAEYPSWCYGSHLVRYSRMECPEIALDPYDGMLSVINSSSNARTYYVSVHGCDRIQLSNGADALENCTTGVHREYITFIVLVFPQRQVNLCKLTPKLKGKISLKRALSNVSISSDVQEYVAVTPSDRRFNLDVFPLVGAAGDKYLCTQSSGGALTHFAHQSTFHAVDFRCQVGTLVVAPFDGVVVDLRNDSDNSGVRVEDLFSWNSIMIKSSEHDSIFCEFVHLKKDSFRVGVGSSVKKGHVVAESGDVGFCPEPHLHMEIHDSIQPGSQSLEIHYTGSPFVVGQEYS